ncbi:MAG: DUF2914 domain-containing protein [bacterium]
MRMPPVVLWLALVGIGAGLGALNSAQGETLSEPKAGPEGATPGAVGQAGNAGLTVEEIVVCAAVKDRVATGVADTFPSDIYGLYCFTRVAGAKDPLAIKHVWYHGETVVAEARLAVKGSPWRTWSYKVMRDDWKGPWKVDVTSPDGSVIASKRFYLR